MDLPVIPIHEKPEYLLECCHLINAEWKRSEGARLHSLQSSCDFLPVSLILIKDKHVIGHAKLSKIPSMKDCCFVESVVIKNDLRGQGYGSYLMKKLEEYARNTLELKTIYLSTKGQEKFYQKLGYTECEPIQLYGVPVLKANRINFVPAAKVHPRSLSPMSKNVIRSSPKTYMLKHLQNCK